MYLTGEFGSVWAKVVEVVLPSGRVTSLKSVNLRSEPLLVDIKVYRSMSLLLECRTLTEYGGQVKESCGGIGYEVMSRDAGTCWRVRVPRRR